MAYTGTHGTYAYVCPACNHLSSGHLLKNGGDINGPYTCRQVGCSCQRMREDPMIGINRKEYEQRYAPGRPARRARKDGETT